MKYFLTLYWSIIFCLLNTFFICLATEYSLLSNNSFSLKPKSCLKSSLCFSLSNLFAPSLHFLTPLQFLIIFSIISFLAYVYLLFFKFLFISFFVLLYILFCSLVSPLQFFLHFLKNHNPFFLLKFLNIHHD